MRGTELVAIVEGGEQNGSFKWVEVADLATEVAGDNSKPKRCL